MVPMLGGRDGEFGWFESHRKQTFELRLKVRCRRRDIVIKFFVPRREIVSLSLL